MFITHLFHYLSYLSVIISLPVIFTEAKPVAVQYDCKFIETSTVLNINIDELLVGVLKQIRLKHKKDEKERTHGTEIGCIMKSKSLLTKLFGKDTFSKSCENLYVL